MNHASDYGYSIAGQLPAANQERRSGVFRADRAFIHRFKRQWPCHGLPHNLDELVAHFDRNGDLVDLEAVNDDGITLNTEEFDGPALRGLVDDIQHDGEAVQ